MSNPLTPAAALAQKHLKKQKAAARAERKVSVFWSVLGALVTYEVLKNLFYLAAFTLL